MNENKIKRYGIRIRKTDRNPITRISYLYDAIGMKPAHMDFERGEFDFGDWANVWFVKKNYPCMLNFDGTEAYKLNANNYALKEDGTPSDVGNVKFNGNAMSAIPLVWVERYEDDMYQYIILCEEKYSDNFHAYAHTRKDGSIMNIKYLSMFKGSGNGKRLRSLSGQAVARSKKAGQEIDAAGANNQNSAEIWNIRSWADRQLINDLLTVMSMSDDSQTVYGQGNTESGEILETGTLDDRGQFFGFEETDKQVKVFHIEGWWGDQYERIAGLIADYGEIKVKMTPPYNLTGEGFTDTGISYKGWNGGFIKNTKLSELGRIPTEIEESPAHVPDRFWCDDDAVNVALVGGYCDIGAYGGASCVSLNFAASYAYWGVGASLSCEQPLAA